MRTTSECVQRSHCAARHTPTQTGHRTHLSGGRADSVHTATPDATKQSCLRRVRRCGVNWAIGQSPLTRLDFKFAVGEMSGIQFNSHRRSGRDTDKTVSSCLAWRCELASRVTDTSSPAPLFSSPTTARFICCEQVLRLHFQ